MFQYIFKPNFLWFSYAQFFFSYSASMPLSVFSEVYIYSPVHDHDVTANINRSHLLERLSQAAGRGHHIRVEQLLDVLCGGLCTNRRVTSKMFLFIELFIAYRLGSWPSGCPHCRRVRGWPGIFHESS